jgi:hypothetical protein
MGDARTDKTGHGKLMTKHPIHVLVEDPVYLKFRKWCVAHGTTPTTQVREMISSFVETHSS